MKIKHWQGYGLVEAKKTGRKEFTDMYGNKCMRLSISVKGNHEWGLLRDDLYDLFNWLVVKFDKSVKNWRDISIYSYNPYDVKENGVDVECCDYTFEYRLDKINY